MSILLPNIGELKASGAKPRVHGNGFLQLDLTPGIFGGAPGRRLHVFDDRLPRQSVKSSIHDHVFDLYSTIILGMLEHIEYAADKDPDGEYVVLYAHAQPNTNNTVLVESDMRVNLRKTAHEIYFPNTSYMFPGYELHDTAYKGMTATIIEKVSIPSVGTLRPRVLVPVDKEPDNEFDREGFDPEPLWDIVEEALEAATNLQGMPTLKQLIDGGYPDG